jgi:hypothetical protein
MQPRRLTEVLAALAGASVLTVVMLASLHGLATHSPTAPAWAGYYVASTLA